MNQQKNYEAPKVMRLGDVKTGRGFCESGSSDVDACYAAGSLALQECGGPGISPSTGTCVQPGSGVQNGTSG